MKRNSSDGFTLIEIMLVVIILAILAMMTIPRLSDASDESREKALLADVAAIQRQVSRYKFDHNNRCPHIKADGSVDNNGDNFIARMTGKTAPSGAVSVSGTCGPYFREWPANPFISSSAAAAQITIGTGPAPRDDKSGWWFDVTTQTLQPNSARGALTQFPRAGG